MKYYKISFNMMILNILSIFVFLISYIFICLFGYYCYVDFNCLILYVFWMFLHEFLHGVGFYIMGVGHRYIIYGASLEKGIFYCMCKNSVSKKIILVSLLFPFMLIGIVTLVLGFIFNVPILVILSLFNIAGCTGDICMFFSLFRMPQFSYVDVDDCSSFYLISSSDVSKHRLFGLKLIEVGDYSDLILSTTFKKFNISKLSFFVLFLLFLLFLIIFMF